MNIGIDASPLAFNWGGIPRFLRSIVRELQRIDDENHYSLYSEADFDLPLENSPWQKKIHRDVPFTLGYLYLRSRSEAPRLDVFWATRDTFPLGLPASVRKVFTVYDLVWRLYPRTMDYGHYLRQRLLWTRSIRRADKVVAISESTRQGLVDTLGIRLEGVSVIYPAAESFFKPQDRGQAVHYVAEKYGASDNYICTVGTVEPRKNLITLVKTIKLLRDRGAFDHQLLIIGPSGWKDSEVYTSVKHFGLTEREIKFLGRVPDDDLPALYSGASLFVYPSLYEGFGIPLVEAMACGVPIVASNAPAIPEVTHGAAVLVSPSRPEEFAEAICRVLGDTQLRSRLIDDGFRRARDFSWEVAAQQVLQTFREVSRQ